MSGTISRNRPTGARPSTARGTCRAPASRISTATSPPPRPGGTDGIRLPDTATSAATFGRLGIDGSKQVVAYDQGSGMVAARLWWMLRSLGHDAVAVLDGGYAKWTREGRPVATDVPAHPASTFTPRRAVSTLDAPRVVANLATRSLLLVDGRARERYRGDVEPLDPVAGHIPGALNRPYSDNLDAEGKFKPAARLNAEFATLIAGRSPDEIVHYCGSGVSACHNLLAMEHAGLAGARLYPGSWSEWCADPAHPVARGDA